MNKIEAINIMLKPRAEVSEEEITKRINEIINKELQKLGKLEITLLYK